MKRLKAVVICLVLLAGLGLSACGSSGGGSSADIAATYSGSAQGMEGEIFVSVNVDAEGNIVSIDTMHEETPEIGGTALDELIAETIETQTIPADAVSGATVTSDAYRAAMQQALEEMQKQG